MAHVYYLFEVHFGKNWVNEHENKEIWDRVMSRMRGRREYLESTNANSIDDKDYRPLWRQVL